MHYSAALAASGKGGVWARRPSPKARAFSDHFKQMYEDVMTVMRIRTFQLIILQVWLPLGPFSMTQKLV